MNWDDIIHKDVDDDTWGHPEVPSSGKSRNDTRKDNDSCVGEEGMKGGE
jgi:hypothetical protein